jgi:purine-binding chemotaxis protein CheW
MLVDGVSDVVSLSPEQICPPPKLTIGLNLKYIIGMGAIDERLIILIDIERLLTAEEMSLFGKIAGC